MSMHEKHSHQDDNLKDMPFLVMYNYRHNTTHPPKPRFPKSLRYANAQTHSIILTRKQAAEIEMKTHHDPKEGKEVEMIPETREEKLGSQIQKDFFTSGQLQRGIPMEGKDDGDILYNFCSSSLSQSYSKLQKILFGLTFNEESQSFQQEQLIQ